MVEIARMVKDWLDGTTLDALGASQAVSVHLAAMTYDGTDTAPTTPTVYDETSDGSTARDDEPTSMPGLQVSVPELLMDSDTFAATEQRGTCKVMIRYVDSETVSQNAVRDGFYVLRAVRRSLHRFHHAREGNAGRKRNNLAILPSPTEKIQFVKVQAAREDGGLYTALIVPYDVMELDP